MSFNNRLILGTLSGGSVIISLKGSEDSKKFRKNASNACLPDLAIFVAYKLKVTSSTVMPAPASTYMHQEPACRIS